MPIVKSIKIYSSVLKLTFQNLKKSPFLFKPFFYLALIEILGVVLIYFAPQRPLNLILAKPIRAFYGEAAVHYPYNLLFLPKIFRIWQIITNIIFGSLLTGITISMYNQYAKNMSTRFGKNFKIAFNRYLPLFAYSFILFIIIFAVERFSSLPIAKLLVKNKGYFLGLGQLKWGIILALSNLSFSLIMETILIYVPVIIIIENKGFWKSAINSVKTVCKYFISTFLIVLIPVLVYLAVVVLKIFIPKLMVLYFPEVSVIIVLLGIIVAFLVNAVIAIATTTLYLNVKSPSIPLLQRGK